MNKILIASAMAAVITSGASAKTADQLRVYINPGHGGWTSNDRPCDILGHGAYSQYDTDTTSFFESNTDLEKGFGMLEKFVQYGLKFDRTLNQTGSALTVGAARDMSNNIVMSRVKNGPYYDDNGTSTQLGNNTPADYAAFNRSLTEISEEVEANNFDVFISIHSNAATDGTTTNYPLFLYRGYDSPVEETGVTIEHQTASIAMAEKCWGYAYENTHSKWTSFSMSKMNIRGDISFYGGGTTRKSATSGNFYKGYLGALKHGTPGILVEGFFHTYQPARHRAMNWDVCRVEGTAYARGLADYFGIAKESTGLIYGIVRDLHEKITESCYKPNTTTDDLFLPINGAKVVLRKEGVVVAEYTTDNYYNGAFVFEVEPGDYTIEFAHSDYKKSDPIAVSVKAATTVYPTAWLENVNYVAPDEVYVDFADPAAELGYITCDEINFKQDFVDIEIEALSGKTIKRAIADKGYVYILAHDANNAATVVKFDVANKVATVLSTDGITAVSGGVALSDIAVTSDHVLVGMNACSKAYNKASSLSFYRWNSDGVPSKWLTEADAANAGGNWTNGYAGESMCYRGTAENGKLYYTGRNATSATQQVRTITVSIINGVYTSTAHNGTNENLYAANMGDVMLTTAPTEGNIYYVTQLEGVKEVAVPGNNGDVPAVTRTFDLGSQNAAIATFLYGGNTMIATASVDNGLNTGVKLYDATAGDFVTTSNTAVGEAAGPGVAAATVSADYNELDELTGAYIELYGIRDGKISHFTTRNAEAVKRLKVFAYDLEQTLADDGSYTLSYSLTGDAAEVSLVLSPVDGDGEDVLLSLEGVGQGSHSYKLDPVSLPGKAYNWAIKVESRTIPALTECRSEASGESGVRAALVTFTDPEQAAFGRVLFAHGKNSGIDVFDAAGNKLVDRALKNDALLQANTTNVSTPMNGCERQGRAVICAWGDKASGLVVIDPMDIESGMKSFYEGSNDGTGCYVNNGVKVGGGTPAVCFVGNDDNRRMYTFSEDHEGKNGKGDTENSIVSYAVGNAWSIGAAPTVVGYKELLANKAVDFSAYGDGFFASQCRSEGNNTVGCPGFVYICDDKVVYNSSVLKDLTSCSAGMDISRDGKKLAVASYTSIRIYDVAWRGNVPELTLNSVVPMAASEGWTVLRFDAAGNLHTYQRASAKYSVYGLPEISPEFTTSANSSMIVSGASSAVGNVSVEVDNGNAVYYNLNGVRVSEDNLVSGVYIKVVGGVATKIVVR
jgi:hypothetical protein